MKVNWKTVMGRYVLHCDLVLFQTCAHKSISFTASFDPNQILLKTLVAFLPDGMLSR
jgi:hypothetical protein